MKAAVPLSDPRWKVSSLATRGKTEAILKVVEPLVPEVKTAIKKGAPDALVWSVYAQVNRGAISMETNNASVYVRDEIAKRMAGGGFSPDVYREAAEIQAKLSEFLQKSQRWITKAPSSTKDIVPRIRWYLMSWGLLKKGLEVLDAVSPGGPPSLKVGGFMLVNQEGHGADVVDRVAAVLAKAEDLLQAHGLKSVCHGNVFLVKTLALAANHHAAAYYDTARDVFYMTDEAKGDVRTLHVITHELGHRYESKTYASFFGSHPVLQSLYDRCKGELGFVTAYARETPRENFCEMVALLCTGQIDPAHEAALKEAVPGLR